MGFFLPVDLGLALEDGEGSGDFSFIVEGLSVFELPLVESPLPESFPLLGSLLPLEAELVLAVSSAEDFESALADFL